MQHSESSGAPAPKLVPVIICGGSGTRLWPVSREAFPKPFMQLADGQSLLQKTYLRATQLPGVADVMIVTNRDTYFLAKDDCAAVNVEGVSVGFVLEPQARNTAAAIAAASRVARERYGDETVLVVMPADHLIEDTNAFAAAVDAAVRASAKSTIVVFGIQPTRPETGFGYIEVDARVASTEDVVPVKSFVEKPKAEVAERFLEDGRHLWNAGMFCFRPDTMLAELELHAPEIARHATEAVTAASCSESSNGFALELDAAAFGQAESVSIDYAVMERSANVSVIPCSIGWSDIGSWNAVSELTAADANGNRIDGTVALHAVSDCYIRSDNRVIGALGLKDLIIVDTPDALLVASRDRAEEVKVIVGQLKQSGHESCTLHRTVHRPWGTYTVLEEGERFKMKRIVVKPGASLSLQMHHHRSEHWIVVQGFADVVCGDQLIQLLPNESTYIPAGKKHRLTNNGVLSLILIEVQCGEYLGEDDIVRFEDVYGRLKADEPSA